MQSQKLLDCIITSKEQSPDSASLTIIKCNTKFNKQVSIEKDNNDALNKFREMFDGMKERVRRDQGMMDDMVLPF